MSDTREKSVKKPTDHKPAADDLVQVEFMGVELEAKKRGMESLRFLDALERNQLTTALRVLIGDEGFERFLTEVPDATAEDAGDLLKELAEKAGVKN